MKLFRHGCGRMSRTGAALAALALLAVVGCVRVPTDAEKHKIVTHLITATANGQTILRWDSRTDLIYTVLVGNRFNATQWKPLPQANNLRGTGRPIELTIPEDPNRPQTYKMMAVPVQSGLQR